MNLKHGRYLLTAKVTRNLLGIGLPVGTRVTAAVVFRASGVHSYRLTKIDPNPAAYALEDGVFQYDGWEYGRAEVVKLLLGHKVEIVATAHVGGALELSAVSADTGVPMFDARGAWRLAKDQTGLERPDAPPAVPGPVTPHTGPILYLPATCGWYNRGESMSDIVLWLAAYRGRVGLNFEATGSTGNVGVKTTDFASAYVRHCDELAEIVNLCAAARVPVKIDAINSNDFGKGWAASWKDTPGNRADVLSAMRWMADNLRDVRQWCIVNPVSEDDASMPAKLRTDCWGVWKAAGWEDSRICGRGIAETHTGELRALRPPALASTDKGEAIEKHFGRGVWTAHTPNVQRCSEYARHYLSRGVHCSLYHRADRLHLLEHRAAYEAIIKAAGISAASGGGSDSPDAHSVPSTESPGAASLTFRYVGGGQRDVSWTPAVDRAGWPTKSVDGSTCDGLLYGARVGEEPRKIEWVKRGAHSAHTKNAWAFAKDRKYNQQWAGGERVRLEVRDVNGKLRDARHAGECMLA